MKRTPIVVGLLTAAAAAIAVSTAAAASLGIGGSQTTRLAAGATAVAACQNLTTFPLAAAASAANSGVNDQGKVVKVVVSNVQASCQGATRVLRVTLTDGSGTAIGSGSVTGVNASSVDVALSPTPNRSAVAFVALAIEGP